MRGVGERGRRGAVSGERAVLLQAHRSERMLSGMEAHAPRSFAWPALAGVALVDLLVSVVAIAGVRHVATPEYAILLGILAVTALGAAALGLVIALRARPLPYLFPLAVGLVGLSLGGDLFFLSGGWSEWLLAEWAGLTVANAGVLFGALGMLRFLALFPRPVTAEDQRAVHARKLSKLSAAKRAKMERDIEGVFRLIEVIQRGRIWRLAGAVAVALGVVMAGLYPYSEGDPGDGILFVILFVPTMLAVAWGAPLGVAMSNMAFTGGDADERRRLAWIRWGLTAAVVSFSLFGALMGVGIWIGFESLLLVGSTFAALALPLPLFLIGLAIAVLYQGALDPSLAVRRTAVYGALGVIFVFLFAGLGNAASDVVQARLGLPGFVGSGLYGGTVAILLLPLRKRFSGIAGRWMRGPE